MSEEEYENLPLDQLLVHKLWKARVYGYNELKKAVEKDATDDIIMMLIDNPEKLKKIVVDSNMVAQEAGIELLNAVLGKVGSKCIKTREIIVPAIVEKGLTASKAGTKAQSIEALLVYIELDSPDEVIKLMLPILSNKLPKLVSATVKALNEIYLAFGCSIVSPKLVMDDIPRLFAHADKNVRNETTNLSLTIRSYIGENFDLIIFPNIKPIQQKDLTALFNKIEPGIKPTRITKNLVDDNDIQMTDDVFIEKVVETPIFDPYEFSEPVDILNKLPNDLSSRISDSNWKERVEVLTEITPFFNVLKAQNDDYSYFISLMIGCLKDVNLQVVTLVSKILFNLAKGLKNNFAKYISNLIPPLLDRTKERKKPVLDALNNTLDVCFKYCNSFNEIVEPTVEFMSHISPHVKVESMNFLIRCLKEIDFIPSKQEIEQIMDIAIKNLQDSQLPVRNTASEVIGILMKIIGNEQSKKYLEKIDKRHLKKVQSICSSAIVKANNNNNNNNNNSSNKNSKSVETIDSENIPDLKQVNKQTRPQQSIRKPKLTNPAISSELNSSSSIPSKRAATSPLKETVGSHKNNLTSKSLKASSNMGSYGLSTQEIQEFELLKTERLKWIEEKKKMDLELEEVRNSNDSLLKNVVSLNGKLDDYHNKFTTMSMTLKSKDTQIFRLRSDLENYQARNSQLEQKLKILEKQLDLSKNSGNSDNNITNENPNNVDDSSDINRRISILSIDSNVENGKENNNTEKLRINSSSIYNFDDADDGWKRATAVTNDLKAKIQRMKARTRILDSMDD